MKHPLPLLLFIILFITGIQPTSAQEVDTRTNFPTGTYAERKIPEFNERSKEHLVTITADGATGQGIKVSDNLIITAYDLVAGKADVSFMDHETNTTQDVHEYVAADQKQGLILLRTNSRFQHYLRFYRPEQFFSEYEYHFFYLKPVEDKLEARVITSLKRDLKEKEAPTFDPNAYGKMKLEGKDQLHGYYVIDGSSRVEGMVLYRNGTHYFADMQALMKLFIHRDLNPNPLVDLRPGIPKKTGSSKIKVYDIGLKSELYANKTLKERLTLDYIEKAANQQIYYFTFELLEGRRTNFHPELHLINLKTSEIFHPTIKGKPNSLVYGGTSIRTSAVFDQVPNDLDHVKVFEVTEEHLTKSANDKSINQFDYYIKFFDDVIINNFPETKKTRYALTQEESTEGSVAFYLQNKSKAFGEVKVYLDGKYLGILDRMYKDSDQSNFCGMSAAITVRLKAGTYKYQAEQRGQKIQGKFTIQKGKCLNQRIQF